MTIINFHIHYKTEWKEHPFIQIKKKTGRTTRQEVIHLHSFDGENWIGQILIDTNEKIQYKYGIKNEGSITMEFGEIRQINWDFKHIQSYLIKDTWRSRSHESNIFHTSAFTQVIFNRSVFQQMPTKATTNHNIVLFRLWSADIPTHLRLGIVGNHSVMGDWKKPLLLDDSGYPTWTKTIEINEIKTHIEYKYVLCDGSNGEIVEWENGLNRTIEVTYLSSPGHCIVQNDDHFRHNYKRWRGAGMAIPLFSLRSARGLGIGEYNDLKHAIDFSRNSGLRMVQILPVNDTIANRTWKDSYPYAAISVFALNPLYIHIPGISLFRSTNHKRAYDKDLKRLNALEHIDLEDVMQSKFKYFKILFYQEKDSVIKDYDFLKFISSNEEWLIPYAGFCVFRDMYNTADFNQWPSYSVYQKNEIYSLAKEGNPWNEKFLFYFFLQYHADKQLKAAKEYGREHRVVLKGDLPIGIYRHSCDAWVAPHLYHMDEQAGAPPDDYAESGQNWGFPTYNWEEMSRDDFSWWRKRMMKLSEYFDALRIDHILGFFRIWSIPLNATEGTMGLFHPRLPFTESELRSYGLDEDLNRYIYPYIRTHNLIELFGSDAKYAKDYYLDEIWPDAYILKEIFNTQAKIKDRFNRSNNGTFPANHEKILYKLAGEILLIKEMVNKNSMFNPRITLQKTVSYQDLDKRLQDAFNALYNHYFYERHNEFWKKQALWKLPALLDATDMLICGEDLGMIPATVPEVMKELNIIPLEIQRMPKGNWRFGNPLAYAYLSVASPSCHDMSTIRGWWEGNRDIAHAFFFEYMGMRGRLPEQCQSEIVEYINREHLLSPAILAIFPLQDLLGMDDDLKKENAFSEQINEPSNPDHYWRYRMHLNMEELAVNQSFMSRIENMVRYSGRDAD
ncbi:MAG TPA: 4-alpha-glucanotransferase [Saprospiraceae bacterium]|nr:4-alpha-glucanotransferase [Saprospiraceae bacterium]